MVIRKASGPPRPLNSSLDYSSAKGAAGPLRRSWRTVMTKDTNGAGPELIVLGRDEAGKPKAARFPSRPRRPRGQGRQGNEPGRLQGRR